MLFMAGADYKKTPLSLRERLSLGDGATRAALLELCGGDGVNGAVILSTCNRTELYISAESEVLAEVLLLDIAGAEAALFDGMIYSMRDTDVVYHLFETVCGLHSAMLRESQIITQVSKAADISRECGCTDSELDVLFRMAVTTGRRAVSVSETGFRESSAHRAVALLEERCKSFVGKKVLVIGNGKIGALAARLLRDKGADVTITLRTYRHGESIVPAGCRVVPYSERLSAADGCDILVSATKSPHFTITKAMTADIKLPSYVVDLAVPRDIEPGSCEGAFLIDIDNLKGGASQINEEVYDVIESGVGEYFGWCNYRENLDVFEEIKSVISDRITHTTDFDPVVVKSVSEKTANMLFGALREVITPKAVEDCLKKLKYRMR
jgi:glutamyl-tRNA reductase